MRNWIYILPFVFIGCNSDKVADAQNPDAIQSEIMSPSALVSWTEQPNYQVKKQQIGNLTYSLTHVSPEYLAIHDLGLNATKFMIDSVKSEYSEMEYFKLKIEASDFSEELLKYNLESAVQYDERVRYCSFGIANDLTMSAGAESVQCGLNHFERAFNAAPFITVMIAFPKSENKEQKNITVTFDDHLFNNGPVRFTWAENEFNSFPVLSEN